MLLACAACAGAAVVPRLILHTPRTAGPARSGAVAMGFESSIIEPLNEWLVSAPYASAFCVTALKASSADQIAQARERRLYATDVMRRRQQQQLSRATAAASESLRAEPIVCDEELCEEVEVVRSHPPTTCITCDELSCEEVALPAWRPSRPAIAWPRTIAFLLYGGLYQGVCQLFIFNEIFPALFGTGTDLPTVVAKVLTDQFVLTPLICLPVAYIFKALAFRYGIGEALRRYVTDAKRDLLIKYWLLWGPVQCLTFSVVPPQWRIPFIACVSFVWTFLLSSISSRDDAQLNAKP